MTTPEHLEKIKAHLEIRLAGMEMQRSTCPLCSFEKAAVAGWRSTITAIDLALVLCNPIGTLNEPARDFIANIITAWPKEIL